MALNWSIENIDTKSISEYDLKTISQVEQDMWAREDWLWEYVQCKCCQKIHSKTDIFWHLSTEIRTENVNRILEILSWDSITCNDCWWDTEFLYWPEYIGKIRERYLQSDSYLTVNRDEDWKIIWFMDWYIDNFDIIYEREFSSYYSNIWKIMLKQLIENKIQMDLPDNLLTWTSIGMEEKHKSFFVLFELIRNFFNSIDDSKNNTLWIAESVIWTNANQIYKSMWAIQVWLLNNDWITIKSNNKNSSFKSDIFVQPDATLQYKRDFNLPVKQFLRQNRERMQWLLLS